MVDNGSRMTFEEFTQLAMSVVDRALETSRAAERELMRRSQVVIWTPQQLPLFEVAANR
jgi:hypothetical protein